MLRTYASRLAPTAPALCAVHCALSPVLALAVPAATGPGAERLAFLLSACLAAVTSATGVRTHGRWTPALLTFVALAVWGGSVAGAFAPLPEPLTTASGSLATAAGMLWNARLSHRVRCQTCADDHRHSH